MSKGSRDVSLGPYRENAMVILPKENLNKSADYRTFIDLVKNNAILCNPTIEDRLVEILPRIGYDVVNPGLFIRKSHDLENFPKINIPVEDRYVAVYSGNNFNGNKLIFSGKSVGQSLESIIDDRVNLVKMYDKNIENFFQVTKSFSGFVMLFELSFIGSLAISYYTSPVLGVASFLTVVGSWIKGTKSVCRKAIETPARNISENVSLIGKSVLVEANKEYNQVLGAQDMLRQYNRLLDMGLKLTRNQFASLENTFCWYRQNSDWSELLKDPWLRNNYSKEEIDKLSEVL